jgi:acetyl-CoA carboxylase beta subunit
LALATFCDMTENDETEYDDDYSKEAHLDRKAEKGWTHCEDCGEWIHLNDVCEGVRCSCDDE